MKSVKNKIKSYWKNIIAVLLAMILLYLAFRNVNWGELAGIFQNGSPGLFFLAFLLQTFAYFVRSLRWRILLSAEKPISVTKVYWATMIGYLGNNLLPARAGELIRTVALGSNTGLSKTFILGTILVERAVDVIFLVIVGLLSLSNVSSLPLWLLQAVKSLAFLSIILMVVIFLAPRSEAVLQSIVRRMPWFSESIKTGVLTLMQEFLLGMRAQQHFDKLAGFLALTLVAWTLDSFFITQIGSALRLPISMPLAFLMLAALGLSSAIPSTPGYIGIYQFVAITVLTPFGFSQSQALAFIIALQAISYCSVVLFGLIGLWQLGALHPFKSVKFEQ